MPHVNVHMPDGTIHSAYYDQVNRTPVGRGDLCGYTEYMYVPVVHIPGYKIEQAVDGAFYAWKVD